MIRRLATVFAIALAAAACGGASSGDSTTTTGAPAETTTTQPPVATTTTEAPAATTTSEAPADAPMIPDPTTGVTLVPGGAENITAGDVFVYWYRDRVSGNYLALYAGSGIAGAEGMMLCPGNSIAAPGFLHITNTPVEDGSCTDFPTPTSSVQVCSGGVWLYQTAIPGDLSGTLYGSLEWNASDGTIQGLSSQFSTDEDIGEFAYGESVYNLWDGFTSDGTSQITCSDPS